MIFPGLARLLVVFTALALLPLHLPAASLQTFGALFQQITNDLAVLEQTFDGSPAAKQHFAALNRARVLTLHDTLTDAQVLERLLPLLAADTNYTAALDAAAFQARANALADYEALGTRVADLPPWSRATTARARFADLADDHAALTNAPQAAAIANQLPTFTTKLVNVAKYEVRARVMPRPRTRANSLRAVLNDHRFTSTSGGRNSPNIFEVTEPSDLYRAVTIRAVDGAAVIHFTLPVLTEQARYEVTPGFATLAYSPDVFATNVVIIGATNGTVFVQTDRREVYGVFTCEGPGLEIRDGRFRVTLPRALRD